MRWHIVGSLFVLTLIGSMGAAEIYTPHARHTQLGLIDPNTGVGTNIGSFQQPDLRLVSGAFDNDGHFYSIALLPGNTDSQLARVDTSSGEATLIGEPTGEFLVPLEVSNDGTMYTVGYYWPEVLGDTTDLFTVNKTDGQITSVGATGVTRPMDLAFDSQGTLWLVSGGDDGNHLFTLNQATGQATMVSAITGVEEATESGAEIMGIMFDEHDTLFATAYYSSNAEFVSPLFNIDTASGVATVIGNTGFVNPHGGDYRYASTLLGDFNNNGVLDVADIDDLMVRVAAGENPMAYDLNDDAAVNTEDIRIWVKDLANTWFGDANLDGEFNSEDVVASFQAGKYGLDMDAGWAEGDWTADRRFGSEDLVAAFEDGGYGLGLRAAVNAVPEPSCAILLGIGMIGLCRLRNRR